MRIPIDLGNGKVVWLSENQAKVIAAITQGDGTVGGGWAGDIRMYTVWDDILQRFEVRRRTELGQDTLVMSFAPHEFDERVLVKLALGDTQRQDVLGQIEKSERDIQRDLDRQQEAWAEELGDRLAFMAKKYASGSDEYTSTEGKWYVKEAANA